MAAAIHTGSEVVIIERQVCCLVWYFSAAQFLQIFAHNDTKTHGES